MEASAICGGSTGLLSFAGNAPDPSRIAITAGIAHRVLIVALNRIIPIANVERPARAEAQIDRNETEVGGKQNVVHILFLVAKLAFDPLVKLDPVGGFVARFDETALHLFGKGREIDKVVAAGAGISRKADGLGMLLGVGWVQGVKGRGGKWDGWRRAVPTRRK